MCARPSIGASPAGEGPSRSVLHAELLQVLGDVEALVRRYQVDPARHDVRPDAAQLAQLVKQVSEETLQLTPEVHPLREGPAAFTRVATGQASGRKLLLIP